MIQLDDRDIKAVATSRFWRRNTKKLVLSLIGIMLAVILISIFVDRYSWLAYVFFVLMATSAGAVIWRASKYEKEFLANWKKQSSIH